MDKYTDEVGIGLDDPTLGPIDHRRATADSNNVTLPIAGNRVGAYQVLGEISRGAMGVVYRGKHLSLDRIVAIKMVLDGASAGDELRQRFANEAKATAALSHPGIVPIFDVGRWNQIPYFAMPYVDGQSLATLLQKGPLPPKRAAQIAKEVADAIEHAHDHQIIHRDLKPANILIDSSGTVRVTDFGVSKIMNVGSDLTQCGELIGTPHYMPPEQAGGSTSPIGPTADVYSIGAVLYAMLTGHPPFQAASPLDVIAQVIMQDPARPSALNASVPIDLEVVTMKCLNKRAADRYATARDLSADLACFLASVPIQARPPGMIQTARTLLRKHVVFASVSGSASLLLVLLTAMLFVSWFHSQRSVGELTDQLQVARQLLQSERRVAVKFLSDPEPFDQMTTLSAFQSNRLAVSAGEQASQNPDLALQLAIASIELAVEDNLAPHESALKLMRDRLASEAAATPVDNRVDLNVSAIEPPMSTQELLEAVGRLIVRPLSKSEKMLYGIDMPPQQIVSPHD